MRVHFEYMIYLYRSYNMHVFMFCYKQNAFALAQAFGFYKHQFTRGRLRQCMTTAFEHAS